MLKAQYDSLKLSYIDPGLYDKYKEVFGLEVAAQRELSMVVNEYMKDRLKRRKNKCR